MFKKIMLAVGALVILVAGWSAYQVSAYNGTYNEYTVRIDADRELVWQYLNEFAYQKLWRENVTALTPMSGIPGQPGETTLVTYTVDGVPFEYTEELTAINAPGYMEFEQEADGFEGRLEYTLTKDENGITTLSAYREVRHKSLLAVLMAPWLEDAAQERLEKSFTKLERLVESAPENENRKVRQQSSETG